MHVQKMWNLATNVLTVQCHTGVQSKLTLVSRRKSCLLFVNHGSVHKTELSEKRKEEAVEMREKKRKAAEELKSKNLARVGNSTGLILYPSLHLLR